MRSDPSKAGKWRTEEVEAAVPFEELVQGAEQPAMEEEAGQQQQQPPPGTSMPLPQTMEGVALS